MDFWQVDVLSFSSEGNLASTAASNPGNAQSYILSEIIICSFARAALDSWSNFIMDSLANHVLGFSSALPEGSRGTINLASTHHVCTY